MTTPPSLAHPPLQTKSALNVAAGNGHLEVVTVLFEKGVDANTMQVLFEQT